MTDTPEWAVDRASRLTAHSMLAGEIARALVEARARGRADALEEAAKVADNIMTTADGKFESRVLLARGGEGNLELAASCAAGMSHAAREIAEIIRGTIEPGQGSSANFVSAMERAAQRMKEAGNG